MKSNGRKGNQQFEATLRRAIRSLGWLLPETEEEVLGGDTDENVDLPDELLDPLAALRPRTWTGAGVQGSVENLIVTELAQAAREGSGNISEEIAERMRRDREAAEIEHSRE